MVVRNGLEQLGVNFEDNGGEVKAGKHCGKSPRCGNGRLHALPILSKAPHELLMLH